MTKTKIKELSKGDHVRFASRWSQEEPIIATVERIVTDMTHYRDVAYVKTWDGKQGVLTDNDSWVFVGGKVERNSYPTGGITDYLSANKVSFKKQSKPNDVQQKKRFEHLKGNLSRMDRLHSKEEPNDIVNKPSHYTYGKIEVIDYCEQVCKEYPSELAPYVFNVIKYISRSELKNGKEDCEKAKFYLERIIEKWDEVHE